MFEIPFSHDQSLCGMCKSSTLLCGRDIVLVCSNAKIKSMGVEGSPQYKVLSENHSAAAKFPVCKFLGFKDADQRATSKHYLES